MGAKCEKLYCPCCSIVWGFGVPGACKAYGGWRGRQRAAAHSKQFQVHKSGQPERHGNLSHSHGGTCVVYTNQGYCLDAALQALAACAEMRPPVDISVGVEGDSTGVGAGAARTEFRSVAATAAA